MFHFLLKIMFKIFAKGDHKCASGGVSGVLSKTIFLPFFGTLPKVESLIFRFLTMHDLEPKAF